MPGMERGHAREHRGAGAITIVEGSSFCVSGANGDIAPELPHGVFFHDTRLVSRWTLLVDGNPVEPLSSSTPRPYRSVTVGRAGHIPGRADTPLIVERDRRVNGGLREEITLRSYFAGADGTAGGARPGVRLRGHLRGEGGTRDGAPATRPPGVAPASIRADSPRDETPGLWSRRPGRRVQGDRLEFDVILEPAAPGRGHPSRPPRIEDEYPIGAASTPRPPPPHALPRVAVPHPGALDRGRSIERVILQSQRDLGSLRIFDPAHPEPAVVAAGAPWFMALFGRDSLLTSFMALPVDPTLALGTLQTLADLQGTEVDPASEEQPGRILHEVRLGATPTSRSAAARCTTALRMPRRSSSSLLGELRRWGWPADDADDLLAGRRPRARVDPAATATATATDSWSTQRLNEHGLRQPGLEGLVGRHQLRRRTAGASPRSRCARCRATCTRPTSPVRARSPAATSELAAALGRAGPPTSSASSTSGSGSRTAGTSRSPSTATSDPSTRCASNMGHCLWTGIVDDDKARPVAERLLSDRDVQRLGRAHARHRHGRLQPGQLPQRVGLAPRQRHRSPPA